MSAEVSTPMTSEMAPIAVPFPSSSNAINLESAASGRKVITAPEPVVAFHEACGMGIEIGTESKGMTVSVRGRAAGIEPPLKVTLKGPHCWIEENKMELNFARTACGPIAREAIRKNAATNMTTRRGNAELLMLERCGHAGDEREKRRRKRKKEGVLEREVCRCPLAVRAARLKTVPSTQLAIAPRQAVRPCISSDRLPGNLPFLFHGCYHQPQPMISPANNLKIYHAVVTVTTVSESATCSSTLPFASYIDAPSGTASPIHLGIESIR